MPRKKQSDPEKISDSLASSEEKPKRATRRAKLDAEITSRISPETETKEMMNLTAADHSVSDISLTTKALPKRLSKSQVTTENTFSRATPFPPSTETVGEYQSKGVLISLEVPSVYEPVKLTYDGLLAQNGATQLYARAGIGPDWDNAQEIEMTKTTTGFEGIALALASSTLHVCFRDGAYNWDNNSNENYVFNVTS